MANLELHLSTVNEGSQRFREVTRKTSQASVHCRALENMHARSADLSSPTPVRRLQPFLFQVLIVSSAIKTGQPTWTKRTAYRHHVLLGCINTRENLLRARMSVTGVMPAIHHQLQDGRRTSERCRRTTATIRPPPAIYRLLPD